MFVLQVLIDGTLLGGLYALVAAGFALVWGVLNIVNVAHGAFMMLGGYITYFMFVSADVDPFLSIPASMAAMFAMGYVIQRYLLNLVARAPFDTSVTLTYGLLILLGSAALGTLGTEYRSAQPEYSGASLLVGDVTISLVRVAMFAVAVIATLGLAVFMSRTDTGRAITATRMDLVAAQLAGINVARTYAVTFAIGAALAAVAGSLYSVAYAFSPLIAFAFIGKMFVVVVLAGLGNIRGLVLGGVILGLAETFGAVIFGPPMQNAVSYFVLIGLLLLRPSGLRGKAFLQ